MRPIPRQIRYLKTIDLIPFPSTEPFNTTPFKKFQKNIICALMTYPNWLGIFYPIRIRHRGPCVVGLVLP